MAAGVLQSSNPTEETAGEKSQAGSGNAEMSNNSGLPPIVIQRLLDLIEILEFGAVIQLIFLIAFHISLFFL